MTWHLNKKLGILVSKDHPFSSVLPLLFGWLALLAHLMKGNVKCLMPFCCNKPLKRHDMSWYNLVSARNHLEDMIVDSPLTDNVCVTCHETFMQL